MWRIAWQELREMLWLMTMLIALSVASVTIGATILAITELRLVTLLPLLAASSF